MERPRQSDDRACPSFEAIDTFPSRKREEFEYMLIDPSMLISRCIMYWCCVLSSYESLDEVQLLEYTGLLMFQQETA